MRTGWLAVMIALVAGSAIARDAMPAPAPAMLETVASLQVEGELDIDAAGKVAAYRIATQLPDEIRTGLDKDIPTWRFEPIVEGEPIEPVTVAMTIALVARPTAEGSLVVELEKVRLWRKQSGPLTAVDDRVVKITTRDMKPPRYPDAGLYYSLDATVLVAVRLDVEGNVVQAEVLQSALHDVKGKESDLVKALSLFERSAIKGAQRWSFDVVVRGTPTDRDLTLIVPVRYHVDARKASPGKWHRLSRTALRRASWLSAPDDGIGVAEVTGNGPLPQQASLRLARTGAAMR